MEHLGPDLIAREAKGEVTAAGTRNARIMFDDEMRLLLERADLEGLDNGFTAIALHAGGSIKSLRAAERWQSLANAAVTRRCQAALVKIVERMVRSRAEAVLRTDTASKTVKEDARIWLAETDAVMVGPVPQAQAAKRLNQLDARADRARTDFFPDVEETSERLRDVPADASRLRQVNMITPAFRARAENRLHEWVVKHVRDAERLRFVQGGYTVDAAVPLTIHRLFRLLGDNPKIQTALLVEMQRRKVVAASMAVANDMMEKDHDGRSVLPGGLAVQAAPIRQYAAGFGQVLDLGGAASLHGVVRVQDLLTIGEMHRSGQTAGPLDVADNVAVAKVALQANPPFLNAAPVSVNIGALMPGPRRRKRRAVSGQDVDSLNTLVEWEPEVTGLLILAAKVAIERFDVADGQERKSDRVTAVGKGPDNDTPVFKIDTGRGR